MFISTSNAAALLWPSDTCITSHVKPNNVLSCWLTTAIATLRLMKVCSAHLICILIALEYLQKT